MMLSTQYSEPSLARLQIWPRQGLPAVIADHIAAQNAGGWMPELTMRWLLPSSSSRA